MTEHTTERAALIDAAESYFAEGDRIVIRLDRAVAALSAFRDRAQNQGGELPEPNPEWEAKAKALNEAARAERGPITREDAEQTLTMLRKWTADAQPANEHGQVSFARAMLESAEEALAWALSSPVPADLEAALARIEDAARRMSLDADLDAEDKRVEGNSRDFHQGRESGLRRAVADIASALSPAPVGEKEDAPLDWPSLLAGRDAFIVSRGLWDDFVDSLSEAPAPSLPEPVDAEPANINEPLGLEVHVMQESTSPDYWLVEAIDHGSDGEVYRVSFSGPKAEDRAKAYSDALAKAQPVKGGEEKGYDPKVHVPGVWRCAKCNFQLIQSTLNANSGAITARDEPSSCPNDGSPMWRVTWKEHAEEAYQRYEERLEEFAASRARVEVLEAALADFNQAAKAEPIMSGRGEGTKKREPLNSEPFDFPQLITWGMMRRAQAALTEDKPHGG